MLFSKLCFVVLVFSVNSQSFDYVEHFFKKYVTEDIEPCNNFFRHTCPIGINSGFLMDLIYENYTALLHAENQRLWDTFGIQNDNKNLNPDAKLGDLYLEMCENGEDTSIFLEHLDYIYGDVPMGCFGKSCYTYIQEDPDCKRGADHINSISENENILITDHRNQFYAAIDELVDVIALINIHLVDDVRDGIQLTKNFMIEMKDILYHWVEKTPWAINKNLTRSTIAMLAPIYLEDNYAKTLGDFIEKLTQLEFFYKDCTSQYSNSELAPLICLRYTAKRNQVPKIEGFFTSSNAAISHPRMEVGYAFYHVAQHAREMASKLGFTAVAIGHEIAHNMIKSSPSDFLTYFSRTSRDCIQHQFNRTCHTFVETSCVTFHGQIDDNGADLLGFQLGYELLKEYYGESLTDIYEPLNITYEQLFFYALSLSFCEGTRGTARVNPDGTLNEHASPYIRVNAQIAQHPAFQTAFQCSDDSRMIRSAVDQCVFYGENAPETKRR